MKHKYFTYINIDHSVFIDFVERHPALKDFVDTEKPFYVRICKKLYPGLVHCILSEDETNKNIVEMSSQLDKKLKGNITPKKIVSLGLNKLISIFKSELKAKLILDISNDIINKKLNLKTISKLNEESIIGVLSQYPALKINTIKIFEIFVCFKTNVYCNEDIDFLNGLKYFLDKKQISFEDIELIKQEYEGDLTLFTLCMWKLRNQIFIERANMENKIKEPITSFIKELIFEAINSYSESHPENKVYLPLDKISVDKTKNIKFGDFTSNAILSITGKDKNKFILAQEIAKTINKMYFDKIEVAGPGFLNFYLNKKFKNNLLCAIYDNQDTYGTFNKKKLVYNIEYVSANPTGLLHIGHARNGAYGDSLARMFEIYGIKTDKEYYINDGGNQIKKLALSVLIRYLQLFEKQVELPEDSYHAEEIVDVANLLKEKYSDKFLDTKFDQNGILDKDANEIIGQFAKNYLLGLIKEHLNKLNVRMDIWSPESDIYRLNLIPQTFDLLKNYLYKKDDALWLKTTKYGDDKDRVVIKSDGSYTYFAPDIAYHNMKLSRGYDKIFNVWGADHKSYVDRMSIAIQMLGYKVSQLHVCIMQLVQLTKNGQEFKMSKRSGNSFTTNDLIELIGKDAARWYLVNQSLDSHITIDVAKAAKKNNENGLFYVQYAYVRIKQILAKCDIELKEDISLLETDEEKEIINQIFFFMPTIENIVKTYEVHKICIYLTNLARLIHTLYEKERINDPDNKELTGQRLFLISCAAAVIKNGLKLIGIDVAENM